MRLGLEASDFTVDLAQEHGITGVTLGIEELVNNGPDAATRATRTRGLQVCQVNAMGFNPLTPDRKEFALQFDQLERGISLASEIGCKLIAVSCGSYHESAFLGIDRRNGTSQAVKEMAQALLPLLRLAEGHGIAIAVEPYIKGIIRSPEVFRELVRITDSDALRLNLDITSLYDLAAMMDSAPFCRRVIPTFGGTIGVVHLKDVKLEEEFHIVASLASLNEGVTDWEVMLQETARVAPHDSWVIIEHVLSPEEGIESITLVKEIAARIGLDLV